MTKKIISLALCVVLVFSCLVVPVDAAGLPIEFDVNVTDFFDWAIDKVYDGSKWISGCLDHNYCKYAPGTSGRHNFVKKHTTVDGKTGFYHVCEYCGLSAGEVGPEGYDAQVSELPSTGYDSAGRLVYYVPLVSGAPVGTENYPVSVSNDLYTVLCVKGGTSGKEYHGCYEGIAPVTGNYEAVSDDLGYGIQRDGTRKNGVFSVDMKAAYAEGDTISFRTEIFINKILVGDKIYVYMPHCFRVLITPIGSSPVSSSYSVDSRPTSITGNYGIIGNNGEITKVENQTIVNETNNTIYNPATGTTTPITDWQYDYSTRTYTVTLDNGTKQTITYGDENITIKEGDTIYNVYYIIEGTGETPSPSPSPSSCPHTWSETSRTDPTCIASGSVSYTCSQCGETKTEVLKALGHKWEVLRTVLTTYDEQGNLVEQGYTIYKCSVCGEQYKDDHNTGPPGGSADDGESLWDFLNRLAEMLGEKLAGVADLILRLFDEVSRLFNRFVDFLSVVFPYLPPEIMLLLTFGVAAVVVVGIIKAFRR